MDTAGRSVVFAGLTVVLSLLGILLIGSGSLSGLAVGASVTVLVTMISSLTLLPALLGLAGPRVEVTRWRGLMMAGFAAVALLGVGIGVPALAAAGALLAGRRPCSRASWCAPCAARCPGGPAKPVSETLAYRWSRTIQRNPRRWLGAGTLVLLVLASPVLGLRLGVRRRGQLPRGHAHPPGLRPAGRRASATGFNGPLLVTVPGAGRGPTVRRCRCGRRPARRARRHARRRRRDPGRARRPGRPRAARPDA